MMNKTGMNILAATIILVLAMSGCTAETARNESRDLPQEDKAESDSTENLISGQMKTILDFRQSQFCQEYKCSERDSWQLRDGDTNHTYNTNVSTVAVEAQTKGETVTGLGIMFYDTAKLSDSDYEIIKSLVDSLDRSVDHEQTMSYIRQNIENSVSQIREANSAEDSGFRIWAGKVGSEQTLSLERIG